MQLGNRFVEPFFFVETEGQRLKVKGTRGQRRGQRNTYTDMSRSNTRGPTCMQIYSHIFITVNPCHQHSPNINFVKSSDNHDYHPAISECRCILVM